MATSSLSTAGKSILRSTLSPNNVNNTTLSQTNNNNPLSSTSLAQTTNTTKNSFADSIEKNPFILPADSDVFRLREEEVLKRDEFRTANASKKVWEKTNYTSALTETRRMIAQIVPDVDPAAIARARESKGLVSAATAAIARDRRKEKETLQEFVQKKRDMFLVQMSLDIKREEIAKMNATAAAREAALAASERELEEEAVRFDGFLKSNDAAAHNAVKEAETQTKIKTEKMQELKKLKHAIGIVAAEKGKLKETLEEYTRYKNFLDSLTPEEWIQERRKEQMDLRISRKQDSFNKKLDKWNLIKAEKVKEVTDKAEADRKAALRRGMQPAKVDIEAVVNAVLPPPPLYDDEPLPELTEEEQELPMYFTNPVQLLEIFTALEESNLFLIQNCQDIETQLDELRTLHKETSASMVAETSALEEQMNILQAQLAAEEAKAAILRNKVRDNQNNTSSNEPNKTIIASSNDASAYALDSLLPELRARIVQVYERCGYKANASSDTISMLTALEGKLESLLSDLSGLEPEYINLKEKEKERQRRIRVREARLKAAQEAHEIRQKKMLERAQAPVIKRTGKPVMFRSVLPTKVVVTKEVNPDEEREKEEAQYFT